MTRIYSISFFRDLASLETSERIAVAVFSIASAIILPIALYAHKGLAPLFVVCALATLPYWTKHRARLSLTTASLLVVLFLMLITASAMWSLTPSETLITAASLMPTFLGGYLLIYFAASVSPVARKTLNDAVVFGGLIGFAIFAIDVGAHEIRGYFFTQDDYGVSRMTGYWNVHKPGITVTSLFIWSWSFLAFKRIGSKFTVFVAAALFVIIVMSGSNATMVAILAGAAIVTPAYFFGRRTAQFIAISVVGAICIVPSVLGLLTDPTSPNARYDHVDPSAIHRILIWQTAANNIMDRPIFGHGFDTSRALPDARQSRQVIFLPGTTRSWMIYSEGIPLHPHNLVLQVWIEMGAVGAVMLAAFLIMLVKLITRYCVTRVHMAIGLGLFVNAFTIALVSYGAWQAWWLAALMLATAFFSVTAPADPDSQGEIDVESYELKDQRSDHHR